VRRFVWLAAVAAIVAAGCGGSSGPTGPPALLFVSVKDGDYAIFGSEADGKDVHRLTKEKGDPSTPTGLFFQVEPAWSPDGTKIAFASMRDGTPHIYAMDADGTRTRRITDSEQEDEHPSWSADGKTIVFSREGAIFTVPSTGGATHRVGHGLGNARSPAVSPDGKLIAYDYRRPGYSIREIYVMNADGTGIRQVTRLGYVSSLPAWSPDGKTLAFQSNLHGKRYQIYTIGLDGRGLRQVTHSDTDVIQAAWTPDGKAIGFVRDGAIWTSEAGKELQLTSGEDDDSRPAWRPVAPQ
jgi:Tol biopolymer transport system component